MTRPTILWLRRDLRLDDHQALSAAIAAGGAVIPVFIWAPEEEQPWSPGAASRWWLARSLRSLDVRLRRLGSSLVLRRGPTAKALRALVRETDAGRVLWTRCVEPASVRQEREVERLLTADGIIATGVGGGLLLEPSELATGTGGSYRVFTPFWRALRARDVHIGLPLPAPARIPAPSSQPFSVSIADLSIEPDGAWTGGLETSGMPGLAGAQLRLGEFQSQALGDYAAARDLPGTPGTSHLSAHLHFGEISPRRVWHTVSGSPGAEPFLRQLAWREFAHHLLANFPHTADSALRPELVPLPSAEDPAALRAWKQGRTGFPLVDAGMRQLWATGWMHNRVRMVVASFLVKDLQVDWRSGARWFWDTLVDADLANNSFGWQWVAGCGADAAPYVRIFNPELQAKRFDPTGAYVRRWIAELGATSYPAPIVDHAEARAQALAAYGLRARGAARAL